MAMRKILKHVRYEDVPQAKLLIQQNRKFSTARMSLYMPQRDVVASILGVTKALGEGKYSNPELLNVCILIT